MDRSMDKGGEDRLAVWASLFLILVGGIWSASRCTSSGDLWVALGCGRYVLSHGVTSIDPFSFNSPPGMWVNQNWLSHVLFTLLHRATGLTGLGIWKILVCMAIVGLAASTARRLGASMALSTLSAVAMALIGKSFFDIRPNMHTILLAAVLIRWLAGLHDRSARKYWPAVALLVLWSNLHGGFLFGVVAMAAAAGVAAIERLVRRRPGAYWASPFLLPALGLLAAIVSPYGLTNLKHPYLVTAGPDAAHWRTVIEWRPPFGGTEPRSAGLIAFWILVAASAVIVAGALIRGRGSLRTARRAPGSRTPGGRAPGAVIPLLTVAAIAAAALALSLTSRRFIPLFAVSVLPLAAALLQGMLPRRNPPAWLVLSGALAAAAAAGIDMIPRLFLPNFLWPASVGWAARLVRADEQPKEACDFLVSGGARGRVLTHWTWGGHLLYRIPFENGEARYRIYMDGRAQAAYPAAVSRNLSLFEDAAASKDERAVRAFLDHYKIDYCLLDRREGTIAYYLPELEGWISLYADEKCVVLARAEKASEIESPVYPEEAIREVSAAVALKTKGPLTAREVQEAFDHAVASIRARPTTTGVMEMTFIAITTPRPLGDSLQARARRECDRILGMPSLGVTPREGQGIAINTMQCKAGLASAAGDRELAARLRQEASARAEEIRRRAEYYIR